MPAEGLDDFTASVFAHDGITHRVFRAGSGPAVVVVHEAPGIHPGVVGFAHRVVETGFTVLMPSLFGTPGRDISVGYTAAAMARACVAREFAAFAIDRTSPAMHWLRALAADAHTECGGPGVGAVGMCFTGGFALGMMVGDDLLAPVLSQPSLPLGPGTRRKAAVGISDADFARVKQRCSIEGVSVLGLRFSEDRFVPRARFETLQRELGDRFIWVDIDSRPGNPHGITRSAHSVLSRDLVDEPGHPTRAALDQVLAFLRERLRPDG